MSRLSIVTATVAAATLVRFRASACAERLSLTLYAKNAVQIRRYTPRSSSSDSHLVSPAASAPSFPP